MTGHNRTSRTVAARAYDARQTVIAVGGLSLIAILISLATSGALLGLISP